MRNVAWRAAALALAAAVSYLLSTRETRPVEFALEPDCDAILIERDDGRFECWRDGRHVILERPRQPE